MTAEGPSPVAFIGLGNMGQPMTRRLLEAGVDVRGYDVAPAAQEAFAALARRPAATTAAEVARQADVVILMLPDSRIVSAGRRDEGVLAAAAPGTIVVDMSSSEPARTRELAEEARGRGVAFVDAPVSGGVAGAQAGTLTIMAGGEEEHVTVVRPLLEAMGKRVLHVGGVGAGHALKALNNLLSATTMLVSSEALVAGQRFGLDIDVMLEAINGSTGRSWSTEFKWPTFVVPETFASGFSARLLVKDMRIALGLARETGAEAALSEASLAAWEQAIEELPEDADHTEIARWVAEHPPPGSPSGHRIV